MRTIQYPPEAIWDEITRRPQMDNATLSATVKSVLDDVRLHGDEAVKRYEERFDHVSLDTLAVSEAEMDEAERLVSSELLESLQLAHDNINCFHAAQQFEEITCTTKPGTTRKGASPSCPGCTASSWPWTIRWRPCRKLWLRTRRRWAAEW